MGLVNCSAGIGAPYFLAVLNSLVGSAMEVFFSTIVLGLFYMQFLYALRK